MTKTISYKVGMTCSGCSGAVTRILSKIAGVSEVKADVEKKLVDVICEDTVEDDILFAALKNWGDKAGKPVERIEE